MIYHRYKLIQAHNLYHILTESFNKNVQIPQDQLVVKICSNKKPKTDETNYRKELDDLVKFFIAFPYR